MQLHHQVVQVTSDLNCKKQHINNNCQTTKVFYMYAISSKVLIKHKTPIMWLWTHTFIDKWFHFWPVEYYSWDYNSRVAVNYFYLWDSLPASCCVKTWALKTNIHVPFWQDLWPIFNTCTGVSKSKCSLLFTLLLLQLAIDKSYFPIGAYRGGWLQEFFLLLYSNCTWYHFAFTPQYTQWISIFITFVSYLIWLLTGLFKGY